jgi:hypothetical protein
MKKVNFLALISVGLSAISVFLPWLETSSAASFGEYNSSYSSGGISGIICGGGVFALLSALVGGYLALINSKWSAFPGILNLLNGLGYLFGWLGAGGRASYSSNFGGVSAKVSVNPQFGLYLFVFTSFLFVIFTLKNLQAIKVE